MRFFQNKNILITGGLGFIGSTLAIELARQGANITIVDSMQGVGANKFNIEQIKDDVNLKIMDVRDEKISEAVKNQDYIFHLAAQLSHTKSMSSPAEDIAINVIGSLSLLEACRKHNPRATLIYAGTRGQYGRITKNPVSESHQIRPVDVNGVSKHSAEQLFFLYNDVHGIKSISLRFTNIYGPRHQMKTSEQGFLNWFVRLAIDGQDITVFDGKQKRDFCYVDDAVKALLIAAQKAAPGEAYNVGSGKAYTVLELAKQVVQEAGSGRIKIQPLPAERKGIEIGDFYSDSSKLKKLGWEPEVEIMQGIIQTVDYYHKNRHNYW